MTRQAPEAPACWFCGARPPDRDSASEWEMHRETGVKYDEEAPVGIRDAPWETLTVPVPRCAECKRAHDRREHFVERGWKTGLRIGVVLLAAVFVLALSQMGGRDINVGGISGAFLKFLLKPTATKAIITIPALLFGCGIVGGLVGWLLGKGSLAEGVKDQGAATLHPNIKRMEAEGWKMGAKPRV